METNVALFDVTRRARLRPPVDAFFRWSRTGDQIAFEKNRDWWIANADGSSRRPLSVGIAGADRLGDYASSLEWSPDGGSLAVVLVKGQYAKDRAFTVVRVDLATGSLRKLSSGLGHAESLAWSPDGQRIAYLERRPRTASSPLVERIREVHLAEGTVSTLFDNAADRVGFIGGLAFTTTAELLMAGTSRMTADDGDAIWSLHSTGKPQILLDQDALGKLGLALEGQSLSQFHIAAHARRMVLAAFSGHGSYDLWVIDLPVAFDR